MTAGATSNGTLFSPTTDYGSTVVFSITNGATAPTTGTVCNLQYTPNAGTTYVTVKSFTAGLTNSAIYSGSWDIPPGVRGLRVQFIGGATTATVCFAYNDSLSTI